MVGACSMLIEMRLGGSPLLRGIIFGRETFSLSRMAKLLEKEPRREGQLET